MKPSERIDKIKEKKDDGSIPDEWLGYEAIIRYLDEEYEKNNPEVSKEIQQIGDRKKSKELIK